MEARSRGEPIVSVTETSVICLLCKKVLEIVGTHFLRCHGIENAGTKGRRQVLYGTPLGSRLAPTLTLKRYSENAKHLLLYAGGIEGRERGHFKLAQQSAAQRIAHARHMESGRWKDASLKGSRAAAMKAANGERLTVEWMCETCGKKEIRTRGKAKRRYCSIACRPVKAAVIERLRENARASRKEAIARRSRPCSVCGTKFVPASKGTKGSRVECCSPTCVGKHNSVTAESKRPDRSRPCEICGTVFVPVLEETNKKIRTCSRACQGKMRTLERLRPCSVVGCDRNARCWEMCGKHYQAEAAKQKREASANHR